MSQTLAVSPVPVAQWFTDDGKVNAWGKAYYYIAGSTTPAKTWLNADGAAGHENTHPIILDSSGRAVIFLRSRVYKVDVQTAAGVSLSGYPQDYIAGLPSFFGYLNVMDYGAVGDGIADDTAAIQAAINAGKASSVTVYMPTGIYKVTATLDLSGSGEVRLVGDGPGHTLIYSTVTTTAGILLGGSATTRKSGVSGIFLRASAGLPAVQVSGNYGINVSDGAGDGVYVRDCWITGFANHAIRVAGQTGPTVIEDVQIDHCAGYGIAFIETGTGCAQDCTVNRGSIQLCWGGIYFDVTASSDSVYDTDIELSTAATLPAIYVKAGGGAHSFSGVTASLKAVPTPAAVVYIEGFGNTWVGGTVQVLNSIAGVDNFLFSGAGCQHNAIVGGYYVNSTGSSGYFVNISGAVDTCVIQPSVNSTLYQAGKDRINDALANYTTAIGVRTVGRGEADNHAVGFPAITTVNVTTNAVAFASLSSAPVEGMIASVTNSSTNAWGATADGAGANHVQVRYNGSIWTVIGK